MTHLKSLVNTHFDTILLDFDGVIADTESVFARFDCDLLNNVLMQNGYDPELTPEYVRSFAGMSGEEKLYAIAAKYNFDPRPYEMGFIYHRDQLRPDLFVTHEAKTSPGLAPLLDHYQGRYALATNKTRDKVENDLRCMGLAHLFKEKLFCHEQGLKKKPEPDILLHAAEQTGMVPATTVYVGDNTIDISAGKAAGMIAVGFVCDEFELIDTEDRTERLKAAGSVAILQDLADLIPPFAP